MLITYAGKELYGLTGTIFSCIYLTVSFLLFGFESVVTRAWQKYSYKITKHIPQEIQGLLLGQLLFNCVGLVVGFVFLEKFILLFKYGKDLAAFFTQFKTVIVLGIFSETYRKMSRTVILLSGKAPKAAIVEFSSLLFYLACVWGTYLYTHLITLQTILYPFVVQSGLVALIYSCFIISRIESWNFILFWGSNLLRLQGFIASQTRGFISGNLLATVTALTFGFSAASLVKVVSLVVNALFSLAERFSLLMLGRLRQHQALSCLANNVTRVIIFIWLTVIVLFSIYMFIYQKSLDQSTLQSIWLIIFSYLVLTGVELYAYPYEKIALAHGRGWLITFLFVLSSLALFLIVKMSDQASFTVLWYTIVRSLLLSGFVVHSHYELKKLDY